MRVAAWVAWRDLSAHGRQAVALATVFGMAIMAFVALGSYRQALVDDHRPTGEGQLVVQEIQSFGEFYGSRLSAEVESDLRKRGVVVLAPEIHTIVGTSLQDAVLLKGIDLAHYAALDRFEIVAGRALESGDMSRQTMIGKRLAERLGATAGDTIRLRGRDFEVVGIFESGSYSENEAWVPLAGAQDLLGWGKDVSLFVVADNGSLAPGEEPFEGVSVARRGELWSTFPQQWDGLMSVILAVTQAIGVAAALFLAAMLWRLARRRQWQIAILRSLGFQRGVFAMYLMVQGLAVALTGGTLGILAALGLLQWVRPTVVGVSLRPDLSVDLLVSTGIWLGFLVLLAVGIPVWALGRRRVAELMSHE